MPVKTGKLTPRDAATELYNRLWAIWWRINRPQAPRNELLAFGIAAVLKFQAEMDNDGEEVLASLEAVLDEVAEIRHKGRGPVQFSPKLRFQTSAAATVVAWTKEILHWVESTKVPECLRAVKKVLPNAT